MATAIVFLGLAIIVHAAVVLWQTSVFAAWADKPRPVASGTITEVAPTEGKDA